MYIQLIIYILQIFLTDPDQFTGKESRVDFGNISGLLELSLNFAKSEDSDMIQVKNFISYTCHPKHEGEY